MLLSLSETFHPLLRALSFWMGMISRHVQYGLLCPEHSTDVYTHAYSSVTSVSCAYAICNTKTLSQHSLTRIMVQHLCYKVGLYCPRFLLFNGCRLFKLYRGLAMRCKWTLSIWWRLRTTVYNWNKINLPFLSTVQPRQSPTVYCGQFRHLYKSLSKDDSRVLSVPHSLAKSATHAQRNKRSNSNQLSYLSAAAVPGRQTGCTVLFWPPALPVLRLIYLSF